MQRHASFLYYLLAALIVLVFVNGMRPWQRLAQSMGGEPRAAFIPPLVLALLLLLLLWPALRPRRGPSETRSAIAWTALAAGLLIAVGSLLLTDPVAPAKRIHIPQYILISLVVRRALAADALAPRTLTLLTAIVTAPCLAAVATTPTMSGDWPDWLMPMTAARPMRGAAP